MDFLILALKDQNFPVSIKLPTIFLQKSGPTVLGRVKGRHYFWFKQASCFLNKHVRLSLVLCLCIKEVLVILDLDGPFFESSLYSKAWEPEAGLLSWAVHWIFPYLKISIMFIIGALFTTPIRISWKIPIIYCNISVPSIKWFLYLSSNMSSFFFLNGNMNCKDSLY